ncbi:MAG: HEAT repeat domain-containing protein [Planctomycetes bacterium]|nr:HEAT repeat domain-containing protein [Planctomycetota bacterium]
MADPKRKLVERGALVALLLVFFFAVARGSDRMSANWYRFRLRSTHNVEEQEAAARSLIAMFKDGRCPMPEDVVNFYIAKLHSDGSPAPRPSLIGIGLAGLKEIGDDAIPYLQYSFHRKENKMRLFDADATSGIKPELSVPMYLSVVADATQDMVLRVTAADQLGRLGQQSAVPMLEAFLHDPEWPLRASCARALAILGKLQVRPWMKTQYAEPLADVRFGASLYAVTMGWREAVEPLLEALRSGTRQQRLSAHDTLRAAVSFAVKFPEDPGSEAWTQAAADVGAWWREAGKDVKLRGD